MSDVNLPDYLKLKLDKIFAGETEIFSDSDVETLNAYFADKATPEADRFFRQFRCLINPNRHGIKDAYIGALHPIK